MSAMFLLQKRCTALRVTEFLGFRMAGLTLAVHGPHTPVLIVNVVTSLTRVLSSTRKVSI